MRLGSGWIRNCITEFRITDFTEACSRSSVIGNQNNRLRKHRAYINDEEGSG